MKVGFVGLGRMGAGMARNLVKSGIDLCVFDCNASAVADLVAVGARAATDIGDLARKSNVIFMSLPGPAEIELVVLRQNGIVASMSPGLVLIDLSTSSHSLALQNHAAMAAKGGVFLDAPISGGPSGAACGDLAIWVGGDRDVYAATCHLLRAIGNKVVHVGPVGSGTVTKLVHNIMGYMMMQSMAECFTMAVKAGMDPLDLSTALRLGAVGKGSPLDLLTKQFLPGEFDVPAFALELAYKDVTLATNLAQELGVPMQVAALTKQEFEEAISRGWNMRDSRAFMQLQAERAGVEIKVDPLRISQTEAALTLTE